jgi:hypothetical protein
VLHGAGNGLLTIAKGTLPLCAGARDAGGIATAVRSFDGLFGHRRAGDLGGPQPERAFRAADAEGKADGCPAPA